MLRLLLLPNRLVVDVDKQGTSPKYGECEETREPTSNEVAVAHGASIASSVVRAVS